MDAAEGKGCRRLNIGRLETSQVMLRVPLPGWLSALPLPPALAAAAAPPHIKFDFKWLVRRAAMAAAVGCLLLAALKSRGAERSHAR